MPPKIELDKLRDVDDIVSDAITFFRQNFKPLAKAYFTINGLFVIVAIATSVINYYQTQIHKQEGTSVFGLTYFLSVAVNLLSTMVMVITILSYLAIYKEKNNQAPDVEEVWGYVKYYFLRILGAYIVAIIGTVLGLMFCIIPGIYLFLAFSLIFPIIIIENVTFNYALDRCFKIIKNNWWVTFGSMFITTLVITAGFALCALPVGIVLEIYALISGVSIADIFQLPLTIVGHCLEFLYALPIIALMLNYFSLTEQTDNTSLIARIENFGVAKSITDDNTQEEY